MQNLIDTINENSTFLNELVEPLVQKLSLNYFNHTRIFNDGTATAVMSNPNWTKAYFEQQLHILQGTPQIDKLSTGPLILDESHAPRKINPIYSRKIYNLAWELDMGQGFSFVDKHDTYCDFYVFAGPNFAEHLKVFFLNHLDVFENFIYFYKESVFRDNRINTYLHFPEKFNFSSSNKHNEEQSLKHAKIAEYLASRFKTKNIYVEGQAGGTWLTKREVEVLACFSQGLKAKAIGKLLFCSPRTVETHIARIQTKLGVRSMQQLHAIIIQDYLLSSLLQSKYQAI